MKQILTTVMLSLLTVLTFTSCKKISLSNQEAQTLVVKTLGLPQNFSTKVTGSDDAFTSSSYKLEEAGYYTNSDGNWALGYTLQATEKGKPFLVGNVEQAMNGAASLSFKTFDIDFNEITGIAINKEQETATVRFSLKATNVTPIGKIMERNVDNPKNGELVYKKFDDGWQLQSGQNKSGLNLVKEIVWPNRND